GGSVGWLNGRAQPTSPDGSGPSGWSRGAPAWLACGWQNRRGRWTFPSNYLERGAPVLWSRGRPARWVGCGDLTLQAGAGRPLRFWNSVAVDPSLFPMGRTWFYLPAYRGTRCGGWFRADDTGGAVSGRHIDAYRPPPRSAGDVITRTGQRILIVRGRKPPANPCR
ncbi:MAG TPA: 3D domain-containing protein, partial [Solirubrobacterales bacterium]|nr:3D domain-containing protein [Solirubrobacterales bacterium]